MSNMTMRDGVVAGFGIILFLLAGSSYLEYALETARATFLRPTPVEADGGAGGGSGEPITWTDLPLDGVYTRYITPGGGNGTLGGDAGGSWEGTVLFEPVDADAGAVFRCAEADTLSLASDACDGVVITARWAWDPMVSVSGSSPAPGAAGAAGAAGDEGAKGNASDPLKAELPPCVGCRGNCAARVSVRRAALAAGLSPGSRKRVAVLIEADSTKGSGLCVVAEAVFLFLVALPAALMASWLCCWLTFVVMFRRPFIVLSCGVPHVFALALYTLFALALTFYFFFSAADAVDWDGEGYMRTLTVNVFLAVFLSFCVANAASLSQFLGGYGAANGGGGYSDGLGSSWSALALEDARDGEDIELTSGIDNLADAEDDIEAMGVDGLGGFDANDDDDGGGGDGGL